MIRFPVLQRIFVGRCGDSGERVESPLREAGVDRVDIVIVDDKDNVVLTTRLLPSLMIRQVKLDIHRMRFVGAMQRGGDA